MAAENDTTSGIPAIVPRGAGHQFVCYADACSGVPGAPHEATFAAVNAVVARLQPPPDFILFPGDEIQGLTAEPEDLHRQWRHWFDKEMAWLDRQAIPLYHTTGNHTTYDAASTAVFRDVLAHLPRNGPPGEEGLAYTIRRDDLLVIAVNTLSSGLGGEGCVETAWLDRTLAAHADARFKFVMGHHPVHPVNGFSGAYQRELGPEYGREFWQVLVRHRVMAYLCSHILAFDIQAHDGVLQLVTGGAGTAHRMPDETEYLHCVQLAIDANGLRYQVLDTAGHVREWLAWPPQLPPAPSWTPVPSDTHATPSIPVSGDDGSATLMAWRCSGVAASDNDGTPQTLLSGWNPGSGLSPLWIGLLGREQRLAITLAPAPGRSPHLWLGPTLERGQPFEVQLLIHTGMGPGGILSRSRDTDPWSSLIAASPWGAERLTWPIRWSVGHDRNDPADRPFRGHQLHIAWWSTTERITSTNHDFE